MNRVPYYDYIDKQLHINAGRINTGGKLNLLHLHTHSENFYLHFFNLLYKREFENLNDSIRNVEAIDLIDHNNKIVLQVSATSTKQKIESALSKDILKGYSDYTFMFISISKDAEGLRTKSYKNPHNLSFSPKDDIHDIASVLRSVLTSDIDIFEEVYKLIKKELGNEVDIVKLDTNLATVINILADEQWDDANKSESVDVFEIERKIGHNDLVKAKNTIEDYCLFYEKVNAKYSEFDTMGSNKSNSVLASFKREYSKHKGKKDADELFYEIIRVIKNKVLNSVNYSPIPIEELELCVDILVVDAFIRCKIFENPIDYKYASS